MCVCVCVCVYSVVSRVLGFGSAAGLDAEVRAEGCLQLSFIADLRSKSGETRSGRGRDLRTARNRTALSVNVLRHSQ